VADADRIAAALRYQQELDAAQRPATMNPNIAAQGEAYRANMTPPTSVMDPRYPAWKQNQNAADAVGAVGDLALSAIPMAGPAMQGVKAAGRFAGPELARGLENYMGKTGMQLNVLNTEGLPNLGRDLIRSKADELSTMLNKEGFQTDVQHSGSAAGPSSYITVSDPQTGRYIRDPARISGHSKGAFNNQFVHEISDDPQSMQKFFDMAMEMRAQGPSEFMKNQIFADQTAMQIRYKNAKKKLLKGKSLSPSEQEAVNILGRE